MDAALTTDIYGEITLPWILVFRQGPKLTAEVIP
jgi:hypothetical protein